MSGTDGKRQEFVYDATLEASVIEAAIADQGCRKSLVRKLSPDEFLVARHSTIWKALKKLADRALDYDKATVRRILKDAGGDADTVRYLAELEGAAKVPDNLQWCIETMRWDSTRATVLKGPVPELVQALNDPQREPREVVAMSRAVATALEKVRGTAIHRPGELHRGYRAELTARRASTNVYPLGAEAFDANLSEGFMGGRTTVSAGLPGAGKTTAWLAFAIMLAKQGRRPMYCGWEMNAESLLDVGVSHMTGIELTRVVQGNLDDEESERVDTAAKWICSKVKFMRNPFLKRVGTSKPSNDRNLDLLEGYLAESGCDVVVYDLWERMLPWRKPEDVGAALFRMQAIHEEYGIHGVIVQHLLLKDVEKRIDKRPTRESIKGTGAYVEVADMIIGIHRVGQFKAVEDNSVETICLKQRKGRANWSVRWKWDGAICQVSDPEEVPFDPGLDAADIGDISRPSQVKTKKRQRAGRRES